MQLTVVSLREAVKVLGGTSATAKILGLDPSAISQALSRKDNGKAAPPAWYDRIETELRNRGAVIPRTEFAFVGGQSASVAEETATE